MVIPMEFPGGEVGGLIQEWPLARKNVLGPAYHRLPPWTNFLGKIPPLDKALHIPPEIPFLTFTWTFPARKFPQLFSTFFHMQVLSLMG